MIKRDAVRAVYVISVAAELAGVHPQTLRIYERKGLVLPARTGGGSRRYSDDDIALLRRIQDLTDQGLNLAGVKKVLELEHKIKHLQAQIKHLEVFSEEASRSGKFQHKLVPREKSITIYTKKDNKN